MEAGIRDSNKPVTEADEDALKWNTDCVYFLASPLTCKKGSECEYRHSEYARVNPRDCWFWLNGNCLNPKCSFRHPPLDGLVGTPVTTSEGSSLPIPPPQAPQAAALTQIPAANTLGKQAVPCIYFQKGLCLKGDRCTFMHGPQPISIPVQQTPAPKVATSVTQPQTLKKASWAIEKCSQQQKIPQVNTIKPVKVPPKPATQAETTLSRNGAVVKNALPPVMLNDELPRFKPTNIPPVTIGNSISTPHRSHQAQTVDYHSFPNGREAGEFLGESSPGFDVLVDDELRDSDYYRNEDEFGRIVAGHEGRHHKDEFGRITGHEGRHLKSVNEFNYGRSADYSSLAKFDREPYNDAPGYNQYGRVQQRRASSERISERPAVPERRGFLRAESPDRFNESDLRHRLSKQRRVGSRSAISPDRSGDFYRRNDRDWHIEEQRHRGYSQRDSRHLPPHESSISNRLQGRITRPGRFSPENNHNGFRPEREIDRGRNRLSPGKPSMPLHQVRHPDRLKQRVQEDLAAEGTFIGRPIRRYEVDFNTTDFAGPKSLSELKGGKVSESSEEQPMKGQQFFPLGEQKNSRVGKVVGRQESEGSLSFEGPKPLSMILKRKREVDTTASGNGTDSGDREESDQKETKRGSLRMEAATVAQAILPSVSEKEANHDTLDHITKPNAAPANTGRTVEEEKGRISTEGHEVPHEGQSSYTQKEGGDIETEDAMMIDEEMEDQELETFDERDEDYDSEAVDGGDFKTEEDENADPDEEYLDDDEDDGDDFAKRIGVMFS